MIKTPRNKQNTHQSKQNYPRFYLGTIKITPNLPRTSSLCIFLLLGHLSYVLQTQNFPI